MFEQRIARAQRLRVTLEQWQIGRVRLSQQQVEKPAAHPGGAFDQLQVFCAKNHRAQHAEVIGQFANRAAIQTQLPLGGRPIHLDLVFALADHLGADEITLLSVSHHLRAAHAAKRPERREQINRFQNVGLALCVLAEQQVKTGREILIQPRVIAEIAKSQMGQMHSEELSRSALDRQSFFCSLDQQ